MQLSAPSEHHLLLSEVNHVRSKGCKCGNTYHPPTHPLRWNKELAELARLHAEEMSNHHYFSHYNNEGDDIAARAEKAFYEWNKIGENIAEGFKSELSVMHGWLKSVEHCEMIMNTDIKEMGAARVDRYWVQNFSRSNSADLSYYRRKITHKP